jgi:hypothetical protein
MQIISQCHFEDDGDLAKSFHHNLGHAFLLRENSSGPVFPRALH